MENKQCSRCKKLQPTIAYSARALAKDKLDSWCKSCKKEYRRSYYERHTEQEQERSRQKTWNYRNIKLTQNEYDNLLWDQQGLCLICETKPKTLVVDHDHKTGKVRGLLCHSCNIGLGLFKDNITFLTRAVEYLT